MKKYLIPLLFILLLPWICEGATGDTETVLGKTDTAITSILGKAGTGIASIYGKNYTDGDGASYADILFYHDFEASTTCASSGPHYSAGDTSPTCASSAAVTTDLPKVGSNSLDIPSSYDNMNFTLNNDDIVDTTSGRVGFYVYATGGQNGTWWNASYDANNYIRIQSYDANFPMDIRLYYYAGGTGGYLACTSALTNENTWYFLEARWNQGGAGNDFEMYIDGVSCGANDTATGVWSKSASGTLSIGEVLGNTTDVHIDQVYHSNDPTRDLNAIKDCTTCHP